MINQTYELTERNLYTFIKERGDGVTFVELKKAFPEAAGDQTWLGPEQLGETLYYNNLSETFIKTLGGMLNIHVRMTPTILLTYLIDGGPIPAYPVVKTARKYKKPHWIPVVFDHIPGKGPK